MSKLREQVTITNGDIESPPEGDLKPYVIFTQLKPGGPHVYAGWVDAADDAMAIEFGCEHYGQDQECINVWAVPRDAIAGTEAEYAPTGETGPAQAYAIFAQARAGDQHLSRGGVEADGPAAALKAALDMLGTPQPHSVWVVPRARIIATDDDDLIWRYTSQDYRMARGYAAAVRRKWEQIRAERDLTEYEKDDLKEAF